MKRISAEFIVDLETREVSCRLCNSPCQSLYLRQVVVYWCNNRECKSKIELHCVFRDTWEEHKIGDAFEKEELGEFYLDLLMKSPGAKELAFDPEK